MSFRCLVPDFRSVAKAAMVLAVLTCLVRTSRAQVYQQTNLVSDLPGMAVHTDPNLVNPWGIAETPGGLIWVADNHSGVSTMYDGSGTAAPLVITVPPGSPTGMVYNATNDFQVHTGAISTSAPAQFIFATEDGTINAYRGPGNRARIEVNNQSTGAIYKGLALANDGDESYLYASDFHHGAVDVFDGDFAPATLDGSFSDPMLPEGFAPFGIQEINGTIYVTYALQDEDAEDDVPGPGNGYINKFDLEGNLLGRFASNGPLNSPWAVVVAPAGFGPFGGDLLIGNFGDGKINAFDPATGDFLGTLTDSAGDPIKIEGLWGLHFGSGGSGGDPNTLYFAAGIPGPGQVEDHGLFGSIGFVPAERQLINISTRASVGTGEKVTIGGFILRSDPSAPAGQSKRLLLRAIGPSLTVSGLGLAGRLMNPILELYDANGQIIAVNNDWEDTDKEEIEATGLAPTDPRESALLVMLATDSDYTAVLRGINNTSGIALVEVYDLETTTETHLANISTRAFVGGGDNVLIGGVIVGGDAAEQILFRAIGPSLADKGVNAPLQDPTLDLYDGDGNLVAHNDNWMEEPDGKPNAMRTAEITATGLAPTDPAESAILAMPEPGNYTVIVRGKDDSTGVALVEAYRLAVTPAGVH